MLFTTNCLFNGIEKNEVLNFKMDISIYFVHLSDHNTSTANTTSVTPHGSSQYILSFLSNHDTSSSAVNNTFLTPQGSFQYILSSYQIMILLLQQTHLSFT